MSKYLNCGGRIFNCHKILDIKARDSFLYMSHPYILKILCQKYGKESWYINVNQEKFGFSIPFEIEHYTTSYKIKYKSLQDIQKDLQMFRENCPNAKVTDGISK